MDGKVKEEEGVGFLGQKVFNKNCGMLVREVGWSGRLRKRSRTCVCARVCVSVRARPMQVHKV